MSNDGLCECGCGQRPNIAPKTDKRRGDIRGESLRYIRNHHQKTQRGPRSNNWKGGVRKDKDGYVLIHNPGHPRADGDGYIREHILIIEEVLGKPLPSAAEPHHADGNKSNNANHNLVICQDRTYHMLMHQRMRALKTCGHANWRKCKFCKTYDKPKNLFVPTSRGSAYHRQCHALYEKERRLNARH